MIKSLVITIIGVMCLICIYNLPADTQADTPKIDDNIYYTEIDYTECVEYEKPVHTPKPPKEKKPMKAEELIEWKLTAYCPCEQCSGKYGRHTATGKIAKAGRTVAVDPKVVKYGTKIMIDGHEYTAEDCGGAVKGYHIDVFFDTHEEVEQFGKKYGYVYIKGGLKK